MAATERAPDMLARALEYIEMGCPVFPVCSPLMGRHSHGATPCSSPGKRPLVAWEPYQQRVPSKQEVRSWWGRWPNANIGMATGIVSGIVVLDCDSGEANKLAMAKGGLDKTPAVFTGKPGGVHYWLAHPGETVRNFARKLPGLDFRGDGGYVLVPPSVHSSFTKYRPAENTAGMRPAPIPDWLWELLRGNGDESERDESDDENFDLSRVIEGVEEGSRDDTLFRYAAKMRADDVPQAYAERLIVEAARRCRPPFPDDEAIAKVRNAYRRYEPNQEFDLEELADGPIGRPASAATVAPTPVPMVFFRPISELLAMPEEEPDWMVNGLFTVASNGWVAAEPKVGKSWVVLELAYALSTGMPFLGRFAVKQPRRVLYVQEEDSLLRVLRRLKKIIKGDPTRPAPADDFWRWSIRSGFKLDSVEWLEKLRQEIIAFEAEVIILDVFNRLHGSDENKQPEMTAILNNLTRLTNQYGCAFIIVHHNRKPQSGNEARANQSMRGHSVLAGWAECSLYLKRSKEKDTIIVTPESKDAPEMDDFTIKLADQENDGLVLEVGEAEVKETLTRGDKAVLDAVDDLAARGIGATAKAVAEVVGRDRSTTQTRLTKLSEAGYLTATAISDTANATKIYARTEA